MRAWYSCKKSSHSKKLCTSQRNKKQNKTKENRTKQQKQTHKKIWKYNNSSSSVMAKWREGQIPLFVSPELSSGRDLVIQMSVRRVASAVRRPWFFVRSISQNPYDLP